MAAVTTAPERAAAPAKVPRRWPAWAPALTLAAAVVALLLALGTAPLDVARTPPTSPSGSSSPAR